MRRILLVFTAIAVMAMMIAIAATTTLAKQPSWAPPQDLPSAYGWGANPELCEPYGPGCGYAKGKNK